MNDTSEIEPKIKMYVSLEADDIEKEAGRIKELVLSVMHERGRSGFRAISCG